MGLHVCRLVGIYERCVCMVYFLTVGVHAGRGGFGTGVGRGWFGLDFLVLDPVTVYMIKIIA